MKCFEVFAGLAEVEVDEEEDDAHIDVGQQKHVDC